MRMEQRPAGPTQPTQKTPRGFPRGSAVALHSSCLCVSAENPGDFPRGDEIGHDFSPAGRTADESAPALACVCVRAGFDVAVSADVPAGTLNADSPQLAHYLHLQVPGGTI